MAEFPFNSSQSSDLDVFHQLPGSSQTLDQDQENVASSSPHSAPISTKPRKPPTVTPKRFNRFFTPRNTNSSAGPRNSRASRRLRDITRVAVNTQPSVYHTPSKQHNPLDHPHNYDIEVLERYPKRQKYSFDLPSSPPPFSSTFKSAHHEQRIQVFEDAPDLPTFPDEDEDPELEPLSKSVLPDSVRCLPYRHSPTQRLLHRSFGGYDAISRGVRGNDHGSTWQSQTANFVSTPSDSHTASRKERGRSLPFCIASCNTNSLVAVADEGGFVKLLDTSSDADFTKPHIKFRPHRNAIMDMAFSSDDYLLATASGDQTSRIVDMHTQQTRSILTGHISSLKQVKFQPGNDHIVTSSGRDGSVQLWDLRCPSKFNGELPSSWCDYVDGDGNREIPAIPSLRQLRAGDAHRSTNRPIRPCADADGPTSLSITTIQYLSHGREHLLLTASEVDASIKIWDMRQAHRTRPLPVSSTPLPDTHNGRRMFGIASLALSGDGARLFAICRDSLVYAYSVNNLVSGCAPQFQSNRSNRCPAVLQTKEGAAPLFALKHDSFMCGSFYIRGALRPALNDRTELLAVGSSDQAAVVFPTDERYFTSSITRNLARDEDDLPNLPTIHSRMPSSPQTPKEAFPVYNLGSALIRGHKKEVSSVCWSTGGDLLSIGDDYRVRRWREDPEQARDLRTCGDNGEGANKRWGCGWATVEDEFWDDEES